MIIIFELFLTKNSIASIILYHCLFFQDLPPTPWRHIITSVPLWGLIIAQIGHDWGLFTIITDLPKYMKSVMHFSIAQVT